MQSNSFSSPKRRRVFLMRHGDVTYFDGSRREIIPNQVPLNERGRGEATAAGQTFAAQEIVFDRVITSGLPRTIETAERVLAATGQHIDIQTWPEWREIDGGRLGQLSSDEIETAFLRIFEGQVPEDRRFLGGEAIGELLDRVLPGLAKLRADPHWNTALLVLHAGVNRAILSHALTSGGRAFFGHVEQHTGCINALDIGEAPTDWVIRLINFCPGTALHRDVRSTTMEQIYAEYLKYRRLSD